MTQEAKVIALEHLVFSLLRELDGRGGIDRDEIVDRALRSIQEGGYPGDPERREAAVGALKDAATLITG
ncbi:MULTISPECIES: hypothetical protein [Pseudomonas]|uniref:Uncharacterized protein n=1 Tax=Pseudomonas soli TaxID=1306993 RepID=A0AAJ5MH52_9PSED|nr:MULTISPECIES: hypothetical protein [Pseudomonas]MEB5935601.1 hypothetical protein [Pseudomonas mosselii]UXZ43560.1 hypothetical protein K7K07_15905 [Pseudomonas soli]